MTNPYPFLHKMTARGSALALSTDAVRSISQTLSMVERGSIGNVLRTPFMADHNVDDIISKFGSVFDNLIITALESNLAELEFSMKSKIGPRSEAKPWVDRKEDVQGYFSFPWPSFDLKDFDVFRSSGTLRPISLSTAADSLLNNTSSGLPYMQRKGSVKSIAVSQLIADPSSNLWPAMLFTRTQEALKTRTVWGISILDVLLEQTYYRALLSLMSKVSWRAALRGPDEVNAGITRLFTQLVTDGKGHLVSIDFSSYDQSVGPSLARLAFSFISGLFQKPYKDNVLNIGERFIHVPLVTPEGVWGCMDPLNPELLDGLKPHGVPSGSSFTNEVDSIVQHLLSMRSGALSSALMSQIQGDDGAYFTHSPDALVENFERYGLRVNKTKSYTSKEFIVYLQNYFSGGYVRNGLVVGIYPIYRALGRLIYLESYTDFDKIGISGSDYFSIRAISILENCKNHPLFEPFVKFVALNDRDNLKYTGAGLTAYVKALMDKGRQEVKNQYGDYINGLKSFDTVKILAKL